MPHSTWRILAASALVACASTAGCGPAAAVGPVEHPDEPVPPSEPRAELRLEVDLAPARSCEEAFDLALYQNRAVELVAWDEDRDSCEGRTIVVRYLSQRMDAEQVRALARQHAAAVRSAPPPPTASPAGTAAPAPTQPEPDAAPGLEPAADDGIDEPE